MKVTKNPSLKAFNTFGVEATAGLMLTTHGLRPAPGRTGTNWFGGLWKTVFPAWKTSP